MQFPAIDPVAFSIGSLQLRWYGLMYLLAFFVGWGLARWRASRPGSGWKTVDVDDLLTFVMLGVILGARLGYVLFYDLPAYIDDPGEILRIWNGGMSFHGGLLGVLCAFWYFARTRKKSFLEVSDFIAPLVPQGLFWGRMGNFINGELWGKVSDVPWAMVFPTGGPWPRHPSQLYEGLLEGLVLFVVLWIFSARPRKAGAVSGPALRRVPLRRGIRARARCPAGLPGLRLADHGPAALPAAHGRGPVAAVPHAAGTGRRGARDGSPQGQERTKALTDLVSSV